MPRLKNNNRTQITLYIDKKTVTLLTEMSRVFDDFNNNNYDRNHFIKEVLNKGIKYYLNREYMRKNIKLKKLLEEDFNTNQIEKPKEPIVSKEKIKELEDDLIETKEIAKDLWRK